MPFSKIFERQTMLPVTIVDEKTIKITPNVHAQLNSHRIEFKQTVITFNNDNFPIPNKFITSTKGSLECLMAYHNIGSKFPKLTAGIKMPDEYYLDTDKKNAFIIEKKTQTVDGSVDEKIQAAAFKQ
jgi:hypothetical protein